MAGNSAIAPFELTKTESGITVDGRDISASSAVGANLDVLAYLGQAGKTDAQMQYVTDVENRVWNSAEAEKQRKWEEDMSNTSYQRAVVDMQKAGINPALAYQQGGASTPSGAVASGSSGSKRNSSLTSALFSSFLNSAVNSAGKVAGSILGKKYF